MSDAAITTVVTGIVTITTMVMGLLTLWVKIKYGVEKTQEVVKYGVAKTQEVATSTGIMAEHVTTCNEERTRLLSKLSEHDNLISTNGSRITALEAQMASLRTSVDGLTKNVDSTRHEMRGHLQGITNKLDLMGTRPAVVAPVPKES